MTKKDIFNFNHIDPNVDTEKLKQIQDLYAYYHKITWIYIAILTRETRK